MPNMSPFEASLLLTNEAAHASVVAILDEKLPDMVEKSWTQIQLSNPTLYETIEHVAGQTPPSELVPDIHIDSSQSFRLGASLTHFALGNNKEPTLPVVGKTAVSYVRSYLNEFGEYALTLGSLMTDPILRELIDIIKDYHDESFDRENDFTYSDRVAIDTGAGFTRLILDTQHKLAKNAGCN